MNETIATIVDAHRSGSRSAERTIQAFLDRIERVDDTIGSFRETYRDAALAAAAEVDRRLGAGDDVGPLAGVPLAVKDNIVTRFGHTTCGSRILEGYKSPFNATAVERLVAAGAIIIGKTNCDEFAMGSSTEHCAWGATRNPWDTSRVPGGSSGGSAAAVASGQCPGALGSDTGGSIRQPAAMCGIVGVKPSYGRVSRYGLVAFGSSLDQIGPLTRTVDDAARMLSVLAGGDSHDSTCADLPVPAYREHIEEPIERLRIGVPRQYLSDQNAPEVTAAIEDAINQYRQLGATIIEIDLPMTDYGIATYYVIAPAEASSNLARYDGVRYGLRREPEKGEELFDLYARSRAAGFGPEVQRRIMLGTYVLSAGYYDAYYLRALKVRRLIKEEFDGAFEHCDAIIGPTSPLPAFRVGEMADPLTMYLCDVYTTITNIAGICGISVPAGTMDVEGKPLPIGVQLQCPAFAEETMFRVARMYERAREDQPLPNPPVFAS